MSRLLNWLSSVVSLTTSLWSCNNTEIETMEVEILRHARVLAKQPGELGAAASSTANNQSREEQTLIKQNHRFIGKCFRCQRPHLMKDCRES